MKIEKLTDNKIRVIASLSDLEINNFDANSFFTDVLENTNFFPSVLDKANKQVGFDTKGCKLLFESILFDEDAFIFTITKYSLTDVSYARQNTILTQNDNIIYAFSTFDEFCDFCNRIKSIPEIKRFCKNISLYFYDSTYFLYAKSISNSSAFFGIFDCIACEFATPLHSTLLESKLLEYGDVVIKNNAIFTGIKYFAK